MTRKQPVKITPRRLPERKFLTVCIAGISRYYSQDVLIMACDRKISFWGGAYSADGVALKLRGIHKAWFVMFAGPTSPMVAMVDAISERVTKLRTTELRPFARLCSDVYREERIPLIENEILTDYPEIKTYADYVDLRKTDPSRYAEIASKITELESTWSLLFAGFDKHKRAHLFTISERGKISYCDTEGFAVIGSGYLAAAMSLSTFPFKRSLPLSQAVFSIAAAKFSAEESADGVGKETILALQAPDSQIAPAFPNHAIERLKWAWATLPRIPEGAEDEIKEELKQNDSVLRPKPRKRRAPKSDSQKQEDRL